MKEKGVTLPHRHLGRARHRCHPAGGEEAGPRARRDRPRPAVLRPGLRRGAGGRRRLRAHQHRAVHRDRLDPGAQVYDKWMEEVGGPKTSPRRPGLLAPACCSPPRPTRSATTSPATSLVAALEGIHEWDAGGLQLLADPGANKHNDCFLYLQIKDKDFVRAFPKKGFACDPDNVVDAEEEVRHRLRAGTRSPWRTSSASWSSSACRPRRSTPSPPAAWSSPTRPRASSTSPTGPSGCWPRSATGSCGRTAAGPAGSRSVVVLFVEAPLIGILLDRLIMRRLADASTITTIVVTIGLLVAFVSAGRDHLAAGHVDARAARVLLRRHGVDPRGERQLPRVRRPRRGACSSPSGCGSLLYNTRIGVAMRAVVDNRELGALNGVDPNRVSSVAWVLGSMLAALAGVLIAPILPQFTPVALTLLVISAYAAAMVGRLRSLPLTFLGAVILGELEYLLAFIDTKRIGGDTIADLAKDLQAVGAGDPAVPRPDLPARGPRGGAVVAPLPAPRSRRCGRWRCRWSPTSRSCFVIVQSGWVSRVDRRRARQGHRPRCRHALARAAHRVRRAGLAGPARLRRHRRGHGVEARARRRPRRRGGDRRRGRRARGPARAARCATSTWPSPRWPSPCSSR